MAGDETIPGQALNETGSVSERVTEAARENASDAASAMRDATAEAAAGAEQMNARMSEAASAASSSTNQAFSQARDRLNTMAAPFSNPALDTMRQSGEAFGKGLEGSYTTALEGMAEFNSKAIAAWRTNAESLIAHWQSLAGVRSVSEAIALSAEHTRKQMEAIGEQTRELSSLATRIVRDASDPLKMTGR